MTNISNPILHMCISLKMIKNTAYLRENRISISFLLGYLKYSMHLKSVMAKKHEWKFSYGMGIIPLVCDLVCWPLCLYMQQNNKC